MFGKFLETLFRVNYRLFIPSLLFFISLQPVVYAQGMAEIRGSVKDAETGLPVESAVLDIQYGGFSNAINEDGNFAFKFPNLVLDSAILTVSAVGYQQLTRPTSGLDLNASHDFLLKRADPIEVKLGLSDARATVQQAVDSMKANNYMEAMLQNGFYREYVSLYKIGVVKLKEATLRVERFPGDVKRPDRFKALDKRQMDWTGQSRKVSAWFFDNGPAILIRTLETGLPEFLTKSDMQKYEFRVDSMLVPFDTLALYRVNFEPKSANLKGGRTGQIYIEPQSKAIVRIEYNLTPKAIKEVLNIGISNVKLSSDSIRFVSQYRRSGSKWVLAENRMTADILYEERLERKFSTMAHWDFRFVATETAPLRRGAVGELDQLTTTSDFGNTLTLPVSSWKNQNYLLPTEAMLALPGNLRKRD